VSKELDTSWFDLKNYEHLKNTSLEDWAELLQDRFIYYSIVEIHEHDILQNNIEDENLSLFISSVVTALKHGDSVFIDETPKHLRTSVNDLSLYEVWLMSKDPRMILIQPDRCKDELSKIALEPFGVDKDNRLARVTVNLSAPDEQIKKDFSNWLANCRQETDIKSKKKLFTQADFDHWVEYGVVPYLDLMIISKIEGKKITQNKLAHLIFPEEYDVDRVGRLRQVTKPAAESIIDNEIHRALSAQFSSEKAIGMKNIKIRPTT
jgi:hypothetical protein